MTQAPTLDLALQARQGAAYLTEANEILYGGAAGGGKSHLIRVAAIVWACSVAGLQIYLFRRLFQELIQNHIEGPTGFPILLGPLIQSGHAVIVKQEIRFWNGSKIYLRHCQHEKSVLSYQGTEIHVLLIDELTHWTEKMYRFLRGRCRLGGLKIPEGWENMFPRILAGTNPGGIGHHWVKFGFVDEAGPDWSTRPNPQEPARMPKSEGGMVRVFIPARLKDNAALLKNDPDYEARLEGLGDALIVAAMKDGDWNMVEGAMFGYIWRDDKHVMDGFPIPLSWDVWRGGDDGFAAPSAIYWLTQNPATKTIYVISEIYGKKLLPSTLSEKILTRDKTIPRLRVGGEVLANPDVLEGLYDSAAFADNGNETFTPGQKVPSRAAQMNLKGCRWKPAEKPPGSRVLRCQNFHRLLSPNESDPYGKPGLIFFRNCANAIRTIKALQRDDDNPEDVDTDGEDHAYDGVCYGIQKKIGLKVRTPIKGL